LPPYQITVDNQPYYYADFGVSYYPSGVPLTPTSGSPSIGEYNPNSGKYLFNPGDAGQGVTIQYGYKNPNIDNNAPNTLNLTFFEGAQGQAPWSYLSSNFPGEAIGYTQLSYVASNGLYLGYTPEVPNFSFEIAGPYQFGNGIVDASPSDCIQQLLTNPYFGIGFEGAFIDNSLQGIAHDFWVANNFFISLFLESQRSVASVIGEICEAGQVGVFWSEGVMKCMPFGTTTAIANGVQYTPPTQPVYSFGDSDYVMDKTEAPIKVSRSAWQDAYNRVEVEWNVRTNNYNSDVCVESDDAAIEQFGLRLEPPKSYDFICTLPAAQFAANMRVQRNVYIRNTYIFRVPSTFIWLDPMDIIEINDSILGLSNTAARIIKMVDDPEKGITITAEDFPWATGNPSLYPKQPIIPSMPVGIGQLSAGDTNLIIVEVPSRANLYAGNILYLFVSGNTPNWGGCTIYMALGVHSCVLITNVVAGGGTLTVTGTNTGSNAVVIGDVVTFFDTNTILDQTSVTVASASSAGFTANYSGTISSTPVTNPQAAAWSTTSYNPLITQQSPNGQVSTPARHGLLTANLASYGGSNPDTTNTLSVSMNTPLSTLESVSSAAASQSFPVTLSVIITNGNYEFLSYETATLTGAGTPPTGPDYNLTTLYRGLMGTSASSHSTNDTFLRLDEASIAYQYDPSLVGSTIFLQALSFNSFGNQTQQLGSVNIFPVFLAGSGPGAVDLESGALNTASPAWTGYIPLSNPLTSVDGGSSATIVIAPFTMRLGGYADLNFSGASITGLPYDTLIYVFFDDPPPLGITVPQGGTVIYQHDTIKENAIDGQWRFFVGSIRTATAGSSQGTVGNSDGGTGAQSGNNILISPTLLQDDGISTAWQPMGPSGTLIAWADGNFSTFATIAVGGPRNWIHAGFPPLTQKWNALTLNLLSQVRPNSGDGTVSYSLDGGNTWTTIYSFVGGSRPLQTDTISLSPNQPLNLVQVKFSVNTPPLWDIYEVWIYGSN